MRGSIRHLGGDRYQLRVYAGIDPVTGRKRYTGRVHRGTRSSAEVALQAVVVEVRPEVVAEENDYLDRSPRWPISDLAGATRLSLRRLAALTGYSERTGTRWRADLLLTDERADRLACAAGLHPAEVWPDWFTTEAIEGAA